MICIEAILQRRIVKNGSYGKNLLNFLDTAYPKMESTRNSEIYFKINNTFFTIRTILKTKKRVEISIIYFFPHFSYLKHKIFITGAASDFLPRLI